MTRENTVQIPLVELSFADLQRVRVKWTYKALRFVAVAAFIAQAAIALALYVRRLHYSFYACTDIDIKRSYMALSAMVIGAMTVVVLLLGTEWQSSRSVDSDDCWRLGITDVQKDGGGEEMLIASSSVPQKSFRKGFYLWLSPMNPGYLEIIFDMVVASILVWKLPPYMNVSNLSFFMYAVSSTLFFITNFRAVSYPLLLLAILAFWKFRGLIRRKLAIPSCDLLTAAKVLVVFGFWFLLFEGEIFSWAWAFAPDSLLGFDLGGPEGAWKWRDDLEDIGALIKTIARLYKKFFT
jgi:hypothetical protein